MILLDYQDAAAKWLSKRKRGLVVSPAASGKTIIGAAALSLAILAKERQDRVNVGWLCNTVEQCQQARAALDKFPAMLLLMAVKIACAAAGTDWSGYDVLIVDEAHHATADGWLKQIQTCKGALWGFTATPDVEDPERNVALQTLFESFHVIDRSAVSGRLCAATVKMLDATDEGVGDKINEYAQKLFKVRSHWSITSKGLSIPGNTFKHKETLKGMGCAWDKRTKMWYAPDEAARASALRLTGAATIPPVSVGVAGSTPEFDGELWSKVLWQSCVKLGIVKNLRRTGEAIRTVLANVPRQTLVLVNQVAHGDYITCRIPGARMCSSKMGKVDRTETMNRFRRGELRCLVATSLADEGLDLPMAEVLVLVSGGRSKAKTEQRTGRVLRAFAGKDGAVIYDFRDSFHPLMAKHSRLRLDLYRRLGYKLEQ